MLWVMNWCCVVGSSIVRFSIVQPCARYSLGVVQRRLIFCTQSSCERRVGLVVLKRLMSQRLFGWVGLTEHGAFVAADLRWRCGVKARGKTSQDKDPGGRGSQSGSAADPGLSRVFSTLWKRSHIRFGRGVVQWKHTQCVAKQNFCSRPVLARQRTLTASLREKFTEWPGV